MGIKQDVEDALKNISVTKIDGQPTDEDLTQLRQELAAMAATIPTSNGGGLHGHVGMLIDEIEYITFSKDGTPFVAPDNPGIYPTNVSQDTVIRTQQLSEHKVKVHEFDQYLGVKQALTTHILKAIDPEWLEALRSPILGFTHRTPKELLDHVQTNGSELDFTDITELTHKLLEPWDVNENPATKFARDDKIEKQLAKWGIDPQPKLRLANAMTAFKKTGSYDAAIREFEAKAAGNKTFDNFRPYIIAEFARSFKQNKTTAKSVNFGIANTAKHTAEDDIAEEAAWALTEIVNNVQATQNKQMEKQLDMMKDMMEKMFATMSSNKQPINTNNVTPKTGTQRSEPCTHCGSRHRNIARCWELPENASKRPANWVSRKTN